MKFDILTLFPQMFEGFLNNSIIKRAIQKDLINVNIIDFRTYSNNKHHTVDDYAYGGGAGMLISVEPLYLAMQDIEKITTAYKILTSPSGKVFNQQMAMALSKKEHIVIICGHYEGIDTRIEKYIDDEISLGDYILTGGETASMVLLEAIARIVPGVISDDSRTDESFMDGLLEYPQYTRPYCYDGENVPEILISGHHANIEKWRHKEALKRTYLRRPDLIAKRILTKEEQKMLEEIKCQCEKKV